MDKKVKVKDIAKILQEIAPKDLAMNYDNVGLLVGDMEAEVTNVLVGLEVTDALIEEAIKNECSLIITHHPLIFKPLTHVRVDHPVQKKVVHLIRHNISLYVAHTNLDRTVGGLNDFLLRKLGYEKIEEKEAVRIVKFAKVPKQNFEKVVQHVKEVLQLPYIHYVGDEKKEIKTLAVCTGSGFGEFQEVLREKADAFLTGDVKYHDAMMANDYNIPLIDAGHYGTECIVVDLLEEILREHYKEEDITIYKETNGENPIKLG